jgi:triosephosphate isomerase
VKHFLANWKMYTTVSEAVALSQAIQDGLRRRSGRGRRLPVPIICPPFVSLVPVRAATDGDLVRLGAQNCHWEREGPHTGEISPTMLQGIVDYVMLGHSERRAAGETDEQIAKKVAAVAGAGLIPILFVGEDEPDADAGEQSEQQLRRGLSGIDLRSQTVLVVYEPRWAIGAEEPASAGHVREAVEHLKSRLRRWGARDPEVIYGGTVNEGNIDQFSELDALDGVGATRASLDADRLLAMIDRIAGR